MGDGRVFADRREAGRLLAARLGHLRGRDPVVLGLPRGGVPVAAEVARVLGAPLDVLVVRKLGVPTQPELAMGAVGEDGTEVLDRMLMTRAGVDEAQLAAVERRERAVVRERAERLRRGRPAMDLTDRLALVVDDGVATGATARAACQVARHRGAAEVVLAVPVMPAGAEDGLPEADQVVCVEAPRSMRAVGAFYRDFTPTTDEEVTALLAGHPG
ncbi:phosphoribosyltransferase [Ornithinimicrobium pekingense]|uniref:Phosphoribosyltransferase domain-containing protein n=1 Tax=Ornithinimicrobium pekingense TaxID=384677 RepID=A0ABQ2F919_9MICO|nr:phosphoribosyltransferase family protein [Ornithinimicrobium pekingense]GGK70550.1 hypothetical protein GCM10011509_18760 [Ornithinimicrobium pekingense]